MAKATRKASTGGTPVRIPPLTAEELALVRALLAGKPVPAIHPVTGTGLDEKGDPYLVSLVPAPPDAAGRFHLEAEQPGGQKWSAYP